MALPVFKTGEAEYLGLAGSIPVRLRHSSVAARSPRGVARERRRPTPPYPAYRRAAGRPEVGRLDRRLGCPLVEADGHRVQQLIRAGELTPDELFERSQPADGTGEHHAPRAQRHRRRVAHQPRPGPALAPRSGRSSGAAGYVDVEFDLQTGPVPAEAGAPWRRWRKRFPRPRTYWSSTTAPQPCCWPRRHLPPGARLWSAAARWSRSGTASGCPT